MAWLVASMTRNFDRDIIANGRGSLEFLQKVYDTAGKCLKCGLRKCDIDETTGFHEFARKALIGNVYTFEKEEYKCVPFLKKNSRNLTNLERFEILESTKLKYNDIGKRGDVLS